MGRRWPPADRVLELVDKCYERLHHVDDFHAFLGWASRLSNHLRCMPSLDG